MADKNNSKRDAQWAEAKRLCRLSVEDVRKAKELGLNPRKLIKNRPNPSEPWKLPVHLWIRELYERTKRKQLPTQAEPPASAERQHSKSPEVDHDNGEGNEADDDLTEDPFAELDPLPFPSFTRRRPSGPEIEEENERQLRRRWEFRQAAGFVTRAYAAFPEVQRIVLFGSVVRPPWKEVPRFRAYRRAGVELYHECKDVDLAVWLTDLTRLRELGRARGRAVNQLLAETGIGVAHHQVKVFLMEAGTDRYLGRLCTFGECPKGKRECLVPGCGATPFLQQHASFQMQPDALRPDRTLVLFDRQRGLTDFMAEEIPF